MDNLHSVKDDMIAFISGNGLRRLNAYVSDDVPSVLFEEENSDSWKDFVEHAKASGALFVTMSDVVLEKEDIEAIVEQLQSSNLLDNDSPEMEDAQFLIRHVGKVGYLQLGFAHQGVMFLYETGTEWYDRYQLWIEAIGELTALHLKELDEED